MKNFKLLILATMLLSVEFVNAQSWMDEVDRVTNSYSEVPGYYQAYQGSTPMTIGGMNVYYMFNEKGVVLLGMGSSSGRAFYDLASGLKDGRINSGTYTKSESAISLKMGESKTKSSWTHSPTQKTITKSDKKTKLVFIGRL